VLQIRHCKYTQTVSGHLGKTAQQQNKKITIIDLLRLIGILLAIIYFILKMNREYVILKLSIQPTTTDPDCPS
jgi:hypothetical protein